MENDKHKDLDQRLRGKLNANELKPDMALWGEIEKELDKSNRRRFGFFRRRYLLLLLLLLTGSGIAVFTLQRDDNTANQRKSVPGGQQNAANSNASDKSLKEDNNAINPASGDNTVPTKSASGHASQNEQPLTNKNTSASPNNTWNETSNDQNESASVTTQQLTTPTKPVEIVAGKNSSSSQENIAQTEPNVPIDVAIESNAVSTESQNTTNDNNKNLNAAETNQPDSTEIKVQASDIAQQEQPQQTQPITTDSNTVAVHSNDSVSNETEVALVPDSVSHQGDSTVASKPNEEPYIASPEKNSNINWLISPYVQLHFVSKTIGTNRTLRPEYLDRRNAEEENAAAVSFGLKGGIEIKRLTLQSGVGLRSYAEIITYENRVLCYDLRNTGTVAAPKYDTLNVHTGPDNAVSESNGRSVNRYIEFPLLVGYRLGGDRFFVRPFLGAAALLPLSWSSRYLNATVEKLENPEETDALRPVVFNVVGEITASAWLRKNLYADFGLSGNRNLQSVFKKDHHATQRYTSWGLQLGLTYRF